MSPAASSAALVLLAGCLVIKVEEGNGIPTTEVRDVAPFTGVVNEIGVDMDVTLGDTQAVTVSCDENLVGLIHTDVRDGNLVVSNDGDPFNPLQLIPHADCRVSVVSPDLDEIQVTGGADVVFTGQGVSHLSFVHTTGSGDVRVEVPVDAPAFEGMSTGSGDIRLAVVDADRASFSSTGSGDTEVVEGSAGSLDVHGTGSGSFALRGVAAEHVEVILTGSGGAEVTATQSLDATLTGSGDLVVWGDPAQRDVSSTGSGEVFDGR